jgi:predicted RNA methylase
MAERDLRLLIKGRLKALAGQLGFRFGGGPFIGPRGGKWADAAHTIPWREPMKDKYKGDLLEPGMTLAQAEDAIRHAPVEHFAIFIDGKMVHRGRGDKTGVDVPKKACKLMKSSGGAVFTHNHPRNGPLSCDDIYLAICNDVAEMRASTPDGGGYSIKRPEGGWTFNFAPVGPYHEIGEALGFVRMMAARTASKKMDEYLLSKSRRHVLGPTHPAYSQEKWDQFYGEEALKGYNAFLKPSGAQVERIPPAGPPRGDHARPQRGGGPVRAPAGRRAAEGVSKSMLRLIVKGRRAKVHPGQISMFAAPKQAGPFIGPRGGKWADAAHTIPWKDPAEAKEKPLGTKQFDDKMHAAGWVKTGGGPGFQTFAPRGGEDTEIRLARVKDDWALSGEAHGVYPTLAAAQRRALAAMKEKPGAKMPPTEPDRKWLQSNHFKPYAKSSDLFDYGYTVVHWIDVRTIKTGNPVEITEYMPRRKGLKRFVAKTFEDQVAMHNWIGAPIKTGGELEGADQETLALPDPEAAEGQARASAEEWKREHAELEATSPDAPVEEAEPDWEVTSPAAAAAAGEAVLPVSTFGVPKKVKDSAFGREVRTTPGTKLQWEGVEGWAKVYSRIAGRRPSSKQGKDLDTHLKLDLSKEIDQETGLNELEELKATLKKLKSDHGGPAGSDIRAALATKQVLVNNRISELQRDKPKLTHEERKARWLARQAAAKKEAPADARRLVVHADRGASEAGWERMPESEKKPRLVVPGKRSEAVEEAMAVKKGKKKRKTDNERALEIVQRAALAKRGLTDEEAELVAAYSGKGGISGDLNQYYTRTDIAKAMWDVMNAHQDQIENVLEPACGSGVFLATAPKEAKVTGVELDKSSAAVADALHGHKHKVEAKSFEEFTIERSGMPAEFDAVVTNAPFCTRSSGSAESLKIHKPWYTSADRYFIDTSLDHAKDGGLVTMIVHSNVMNARNPAAREFRERILARAEVLDAYRLPKEAWAHTHTEVVADVLVLRKRDSRVGEALATMSRRDRGVDGAMTALGAWDQNFVDGLYFEERPDRVLGKALSADETGFRATVTGDAEKVAPDMRRLTEEKLARPKEAAAKPITYEALVELGKENEALADSLKRAEAELAKAAVPPAIGNVKTFAGSRYLYIGEPPKWTLMESVDDVSQIITASGDEAVKQAHELALDLAALMRARDAGEFYKARNMRRLTATRVKEWVAEHGIPGSHRALGELSKSAPQLLDFIACVDSNGELSDVLSKDAAVTLKAAEVDRSDLSSVAGYVARRNRGYVTTEDVQHNWEGWEDQSEDEIRRQLLGTGDYCLDAEGRTNLLEKPPIQHVEDYLTGNLYDKLDAEERRLEVVEGEERAQVQRQIALIKERLESRRRSIDDIPIQLRVMGWMPLEWFDEYLNSPEGRKTCFSLHRPLGPGELRAKMVYDKGVYTLTWVAPEGGYKMKRRLPNPGGYGYTEQSYVAEPGTVINKTADTYDFLRYMNRLSLRRERVEDVESHVEEEFNQWIKESPRRAELEAVYNRTFNSEFRREYSGDPLGLEGIREGIVPHDFQNAAVRWALEQGSGILAQDVGLGKTFIAILLARMRKQQGTSRRPMVVVPKSVATNWAEEVETLFPGSKVLVIGEHLSKSGRTVSDNDMERNRKLAMVKQNEYDLIIVTKPAFDRIPLKEKTVESYEEQDYWYQRSEQIDQIRGSSTQETADKKIARLKASWGQQKLKEKFQHAESLVYWEDLGIDTLMADEAHAYKNLYTAKSRFGQSPKFLGGSGQSKQARKMQHMSKWVREANQTNGVYFLTATPTKNSPLEVFNMLQHINPEAFHRLGIENSEQFIDRFCKLESRLILTPPGKEKKAKDDDDTQFADEFEGAGNLESAMCVTGFTNLKELEDIMDNNMMIQTATDVGLKIPDANYQTHLVEMTQEQKAVYHQLRNEADELDREEDPGGMFRLLDQMKKAAQDLELYDPEDYKGWYTNSPKYKACVESAAEGARSRGGQIVFCDHNASHGRLKAMLVAKGLKESEVGIINAQVAKDSAARQAIGNAFNRGEIKVVIGNTGTMGEGVNLQGKKHERGTTDIHHLDQPWDPGTMHQRNGRGVRQGNRAEQVDVHTYLSTGSFDGFRHSTLKGKERWLDKLRSGANEISNEMEGQSMDDVEMLAMLSDDPDAALEAIKDKRASAESAWYAKQAQESVDIFYKWQQKVQRLGKLEGEAAQRLSGDVERIRRQLLRNELLPLELKEHLKSGDTAPVAVYTHMVGEGEAARLAAKTIRPGDVVEDQYNKWVVRSVNLTDRKVYVRSWGYGSSHARSIDELTTPEHKVGRLHEVDELKEILRDGMDHSYSSPLGEMSHISEATLEANRGLVDEQVTAWYEKYGGDDKVMVRTEAGIAAMKSDDAAGLERVYPWGKDRAELVEAVVAANRDDQWNPYHNSLLEVGRVEYGMSGYNSSNHFKKVAQDAELRWKELKQQGNLPKPPAEPAPAPKRRLVATGRGFI